jgi:MoaA/NifB/PqqE/SkfB family radical SAM enzyme
MTDILNTYTDFLPPELKQLTWRLHPMDGKLLLFERDTGLNILLEGEETAHLTRIAPRTLLVAVTNICNLTCHFCYRNLKSPSEWTYDSLLDFCKSADDWGVLEMAFGGGEPMLFPNWEDFIHQLYDETQLAINFTTNGMMLTDDFLQAISGKYGNIRLSLYDTNHYEETIRKLVANGARFGVNWMITSDDLPTIENKFLHLLGLGVRDFLLISYKGNDARLHFSSEHYVQFAEFVNQMYTSLNGLAEIKLDVCWGNSQPDVPRLFTHEDCGALDGFISITSDKQLKPCSFHHWTIPFDNLADIRTFWEKRRQQIIPAMTGGCARFSQRALNPDGTLQVDIIQPNTILNEDIPS